VVKKQSAKNKQVKVHIADKYKRIIKALKSCLKMGQKLFDKPFFAIKSTHFLNRSVLLKRVRLTIMNFRKNL